MLPDHHFQDITRQICHLIECSSTHLLLGCPEVALRHPLLDLCAANVATTYMSVASHGSNVSTATKLVEDEYIRALCDTALQTGHIQSVNQFQFSSSQNAAIHSVCIVLIRFSICQAKSAWRARIYCTNAKACMWKFGHLTQVA